MLAIFLQRWITTAWGFGITFDFMGPLTVAWSKFRLYTTQNYTEVKTAIKYLVTLRWEASWQQYFSLQITQSLDATRTVIAPNHRIRSPYKIESALFFRITSKNAGLFPPLRHVSASVFASLRRMVFRWHIGRLKDNRQSHRLTQVWCADPGLSTCRSGIELELPSLHANALLHFPVDDYASHY